MRCITTIGQPATRALARHTLKTLLTSGFDTSGTAVQLPVQSSSMQIAARDHLILTLVSQFGQLATPQIKDLVFSETTRTPCDRALNRLVSTGKLELVEPRNSGGRQGGSLTNVYQLGPNGWPIFFEGRRKFNTVAHAHKLAVADVFVAVTKAKHMGWFDILEWHVEDEAWVTVAGSTLKPDLYLDLGDGNVLWIEVDLGGERQKQIIEKLERYMFAYNNDESLQLDTFPHILFLVTTSDRVRELEQIIKRTPNLETNLFSVGLLEKFPRPPH